MRFLGAMALILTAVLFLGSCARGEVNDLEVPPIDPEPVEPISLTLYFSDPHGGYMLAEAREVAVSEQDLPARALGELVKGPDDPLLSPSLPPETRVLGVEVAEGTAFVNFSRELVDKHWGGTVGELVTARSVVYTLTELSGIERVQFLIEGVAPPETLLGHLDVREPLEPEVIVGSLHPDPERLEALQERVDGGREQWRLEAVEVLLREGPGAGLRLDPEDVVETVREGERKILTVEYRDRRWTVALEQPVRSGSDGIWAMVEILPD